jgi:phenylalanine-4-hydroxylase
MSGTRLLRIPNNLLGVQRFLARLRMLDFHAGRMVDQAYIQRVFDLDIKQSISSVAQLVARSAVIQPCLATGRFLVRSQAEEDFFFCVRGLHLLYV